MALDAKAQLERAGYVVVLSRDGDPDPARQTLWQKGLRAETAMGGAPADIGVSIHTDLPDTVGAGQIYYDQLGGFRTNTSDGLTARFTDERSAALSRQYALSLIHIFRFRATPHPVGRGARRGGMPLRSQRRADPPTVR